MDIQLKLILCILIIGFISGIDRTVVSNNNFNRLIVNYSLAKGKITQYFVPNLKGGVSSRGISSSTNYIKYIYTVDTKIIENAYDFNSYIDIPNIKPNLDIEYLVIFENTNFKNSFILLNYPLSSDGDFDLYKKQFEIKIPKNAFKH